MVYPPEGGEPQEIEVFQFKNGGVAPLDLMIASWIVEMMVA